MIFIAKTVCRCKMQREVVENFARDLKSPKPLINPHPIWCWGSSRMAPQYSLSPEGAFSFQWISISQISIVTQSLSLSPTLTISLTHSWPVIGIRQVKIWRNESTPSRGWQEQIQCRCGVGLSSEHEDDKNDASTAVRSCPWGPPPPQIFSKHEILFLWKNHFALVLDSEWRISTPQSVSG